MQVLQAYRFALDPSPRAASALASHVGARRFAYNWGLAVVKERLDARRCGEPVEVPWSLPALRREWNRAKEEAAPWWRENSKEAYSAGLDGLARALRAFSASKHGKRKGRRMGFPRFRKRGRGRESVRFTTGAIRVDDHDAAMAGIRRQLRYKHIWYGSALTEAPVDYPSSKRCSACGAVKADLALWERTFRCPGCGLVLDRDLNAARNLAALVAAVAGSGPGRTNAREGDVSPGLAGQTPMKREAGAGASVPSQTGAADPQGSAA